MADFFLKWPDIGEGNYGYNQDETIIAEGQYEGQTGEGIKDFGNLVSQSETFAPCAVKRNFEFLHGREMTNTEENNILDTYSKLLIKNNFKMKPVLLNMIKAKAFSDKFGGQ